MGVDIDVTFIEPGIVVILDSGAMARRLGGDEMCGPLAAAPCWVCYGATLRPCPTIEVGVALLATMLDAMAKDAPVQYEVDVDDRGTGEKILRLMQERGTIVEIPSPTPHATLH